MMVCLSSMGDVSARQPVNPNRAKDDYFGIWENRTNGVGKAELGVRQNVRIVAFLTSIKVGKKLQYGW
jgi:hypothetical protein